MPVVRPGARLWTRAILGLFVIGAVTLAFAAWWPTLASTATSAGYTITGSGGTYTATPQGGGSGYSGSLKSVVQSAATTLSNGSGGTITFDGAVFDLGDSWFEFKNISNVTFQGLGMNATVIQNNSSQSADTEPFNTSTTENFVVRDMTVNAGGPFRSTSDALDFDGGNHNLVERVKVAQSRGRGIVFDGKDKVSGTPRTADNNIIRDCVVTGVSAHGIQFLASRDNRVEGCTITDVAGHGIEATKSSSIADQPHKKPNGNLITGNFIYNAGGDGVHINSGDGSQILGNTIFNSGNASSGRDGIRIISNDSIACDDNVVSGNRAGDDQSSKTQRYGLHIASSLCHATVVGTGNDFSGNLSGPIHDSGTGTIYLSGPAPDTTPPTVPTGLAGTVAGPDQVDLSWSASADNVAVAGYRIFRDGSQIATSPTASFSDTSAQPSTTHSYYVRAYDAANNVSAPSNTVSITTPAAPDAASPTAPTGLAGTAVSPTQVNLTWSPSSDNVAVAGYRIFRDGGEIATSATASYSDTSALPNTTHSYRVRAYDTSNNLSSQSNAAAVTTPAPPDTVAPTAPTGLAGAASSPMQVNLSWNPSADNIAVTGYQIFRDGFEIATSPTASFSDMIAQPSTTHSYYVRAYDASGNLSAPSSAAAVTTPAPPDTTPPTVPTGLAAAATGATQVDLAWSPSADNVAVAGYRIFRDAGQIATSATASYSDAAVQPGSTHSYQVIAYDAAGNASASSGAVTVTTPTLPPPPPPVGGQPFTSTFTPTDDATVAQAQPSANFGSGKLEADASPVKNFLLRFDVSGVGSGTVNSVKLRIFCTDNSPSGGQVRATDGAWNESTVTWTSAPAAGTAAPTTLGQVSAGHWYEIDVTPLVRGDGVVSLRVATAASDGGDFASKETSTKPQLIVNGVSAQDPPPTTDPGDPGDPSVDLPSWVGFLDGPLLALPGPSGSNGPNATISLVGSARRVRVRRRGIVVAVLCPMESCVATAHGTISGRRSRKALKLRPDDARIFAGAEGKLRLRLSRAARTAVRRALARHRRLVVTVEVEIRFDSGETTTLRRKVKLSG